MSDAAASMTTRAAREALGVAPLAGPGEIRRAFREAAKRAHPDRAGGSPEQFRQVVDAYHLLQHAPKPSERFVQPPATWTPPPAALTIGPLMAMTGGTLDHRLADGRTIRLTLPPGLRTGDTVRAGDTRLPVTVRGEADLLVRGHDLWLTVQAPSRTLAEGGRLALDTPLGRRIVWVTKKAGERGLVRLEGQGLPARGRHPQGHLFLRLAPMKSSTDSAARTLLRRFAAAWAA